MAAEESNTTEWEDQLIKHGIIAPLPERKSADEEHLEALEARAARDPLAGKTLEQLDELEDDLDDDVLARYREQRMAELKAKRALERFGEVKQISKQDYNEHVTQASQNAWVVVHLFLAGKRECQLLNRVLSETARRHKAVKFVKIVGAECVPNFPDAACPTLIFYHKGDTVKQIVGLQSLGGLKVNADCIEWELKRLGAVESDLESDPKEAAMRTTVERHAGRAAARDSDSEDEGEGSDEDD
jgi:hypothetical protein